MITIHNTARNQILSVLREEDPNATSEVRAFALRLIGEFGLATRYSLISSNIEGLDEKIAAAKRKHGLSEYSEGTTIGDILAAPVPEMPSKIEDLIKRRDRYIDQLSEIEETIAGIADKVA